VPKTEDHAARLKRMRSLCATLDALHVEAQHLCADITAEARRANGTAYPKRKAERRRNPR
jgi:hypothetical protein